MSDTQPESLWQGSERRRQSAIGTVSYYYGQGLWWPSGQVNGRLENPESKVDKDRNTVEQKR
jgi:hypothetical protein